MPTEEAEICMRAVDAGLFCCHHQPRCKQQRLADLCFLQQKINADGDNKIGFEDYLAFAARSKDRWLVSEFSNVLNAVKEIQRGA